VRFDGDTHAGKFAIWYWSGDALRDSRGTSLVDVHPDSEEFQVFVSKRENT